MKSTAPILLVLTWLVPASAAAQEGQTPRDDTWKTVFDLAFTSVSGNERVTLLASEMRLTHLERERYEMELAFRARYGRSEGEEVAKNYRLQLRTDLAPGGRVSPFISTTAEHDPFRKLDVRANGGAGARYKLWRSDHGEADVSAALLYSYEDYGTVTIDDAVSAFQQDARWSWRVQGKRQVSEGVRVEHRSLYEPIWNRGGDYLLEVETSARAVITSTVALSFTHSYERDSTPRPEVREDDQVFRVGLTFEL